MFCVCYSSTISMIWIDASVSDKITCRYSNEKLTLTLLIFVHVIILIVWTLICVMLKYN